MSDFAYPIFGFARPTTGLKPCVTELVAQDLQRYPVLQGQGHCGCERIHQSGNGRSLLGHPDEHFTGESVFVQTDSDIALLPAHTGGFARGCPPRSDSGSFGSTVR